MIDTVFGIKVRMSSLCINRYWPIIGRLLDADYRHCLIGASLILYLFFCCNNGTKCYNYHVLFAARCGVSRIWFWQPDREMLAW